MGTVRDDTHTVAPPGDRPAGLRPVRLPGQPHGPVTSLYASSAYTNARARVQEDSSSSASNRRCLSVSAPSILVSLMWCRARNFLHLVVPQRRWLISSSPIAHVSASSGGSRMTSAAAASPSAILRFSSARANRTAFARSSARNLCGAGLTVAVSDIRCFVSSHSSAWADLDVYERAGVNLGPLPWVLYGALLFRTPRRAVCCPPPFPAFPTLPATCPARPSR
jgi:hypothetical protein